MGTVLTFIMSTLSMLRVEIDEFMIVGYVITLCNGTNIAMNKNGNESFSVSTKNTNCQQ